MGIRPAWILNRLNSRAKTIYEDRGKMENLLKDSEGTGRKPGIRQMYDDIRTLVELLRDYKSGAYRELSRSSALLIIGGLIYLVSPIDLLPDFILGLGFLDDAVILGYVIKQLFGVLDHYKTWKQGIASPEYTIEADDFSE